MKPLLFLMLVPAIQASAQRTVPQTNAISVYGQVQNDLRLDVVRLNRFRTQDIGDYSVRNHHGEVKYTMHHVKGVLLTDIIDSAGITYEKPKQLSGTVIMLRASDGFSVAYSWSELYNTPTGKHVFVIMESDNRPMPELKESIVVICTSDGNNGSRFIRGTESISVAVPH